MSAHNTWRRGWKAIAEMSGSDRELHKRIGTYLDEQGITNAIEGSKAYCVFVLLEQAEEAIRLLHEYGRVSDDAIDVVESNDSNTVVVYPLTPL